MAVLGLAGPFLLCASVRALVAALACLVVIGMCGPSLQPWPAQRRWASVRALYGAASKSIP